MDRSYPEKSKQKRRLSFVADSEATWTAAENVAVRGLMVADGRGSKRIADEMELVEQELEAVATAMMHCQPAGGYDLLAIRWWKRGAAAGGTFRTPVLVRMERYGRHIRPVQIHSAAVRARQDGAFRLNYDLVDRLVPFYWRGYRVWKGLSLEWSAYTRLEARVRKLAASMDAQADRATAEAIGRMAVERLEVVRLAE